jgi:hypothetical protein
MPALEGKQSTSENNAPKNDVGAAGEFRHLAVTLSNRQNLAITSKGCAPRLVYHDND